MGRMIILFFMTAMMSGCTTFPQVVRTEPYTMELTVKVTSEPSDAEVYFNDRLIGRTPAESLTIGVPSTEEKQWYGSSIYRPNGVDYLKVHKEGYKDIVTPLEYEIDSAIPRVFFHLAKREFHFVLEKITKGGETGTADEILKLKKLMDDGVITKDEFEKKKKELLGL